MEGVDSTKTKARRFIEFVQRLYLQPDKHHTRLASYIQLATKAQYRLRYVQDRIRFGLQQSDTLHADSRVNPLDRSL